jgi:hypothetical protein
MSKALGALALAFAASVTVSASYYVGYTRGTDSGTQVERAYSETQPITVILDGGTDFMGKYALQYSPAIRTLVITDGSAQAPYLPLPLTLTLVPKELSPPDRPSAGSVFLSEWIEHG